MGFDKSVFEKFVETGTRAAGTYAQSYLMYMASNAAASGLWTFDANSEVEFLGTMNIAGQFYPTGTIKHHVHASVGEYAYQLRTESNLATGNFFGMDAEVHQMISRTSGAVRGLSMTGRLTAAKTMSGSSSLLPIYGNVDIDGIIDGSGVMLAAGYFVLSDGGTFTDLSHYACVWLDSQQTGTVNGNHEFVYMSNNGATVMDSAFFLRAGNSVTNLFTIQTASNMVSDTATTSAYTYTKWKRIKVNIGGNDGGVGAETGYLIVDIV